jgi:tRNA pseudouridine32 synthase/23S rRNA pseudouridine746 synthase
MGNVLEIIYQDSYFLIIDKPADLLAVPGRGPDKQDCVVNRARSLFPGMIEQPAVHRLDQQTSGLMIVALNASAHQDISRQFQNRRVVKHYVAIVGGAIEAESGRIALPLRLDPGNRPRQIYDPVNGKEAITLWRRIVGENRTTRIIFTPLTGRTHQLRVHSAHPRGLNAPIVGDRLYGTGTEGDTMLLHASYLSFNHPADGQIVAFDSDPPF